MRSPNGDVDLDQSAGSQATYSDDREKKGHSYESW